MVESNCTPTLRKQRHRHEIFLLPTTVSVLSSFCAVIVAGVFLVFSWQGERLKEATKINLSLSALGNVISALVSKPPSELSLQIEVKDMSQFQISKKTVNETNKQTNEETQNNNNTKKTAATAPRQTNQTNKQQTSKTKWTCFQYGENFSVIHERGVYQKATVNR